MPKEYNIGLPPEEFQGYQLDPTNLMSRQLRAAWVFGKIYDGNLQVIGGSGGHPISAHTEEQLLEKLEKEIASTQGDRKSYLQNILETHEPIKFAGDIEVVFPHSRDPNILATRKTFIT